MPQIKDAAAAQPAKQKRDTVRRPQKEQFAGDGPVGQDHPRDMPVEGAAKLSEQVIETVDGPNAMKHAEELAFMEELIEVIVHHTTDANADPLPHVGVNGRRQFFQRGERQTVRRCFVERLARARNTRYTQERGTDANGADVIRNVPHTSLQYPFSVMRDDNPRGAEWLNKILQEA